MGRLLRAVAPAPRRLSVGFFSASEDSLAVSIVDGEDSLFFFGPKNRFRVIFVYYFWASRAAQQTVSRLCHYCMNVDSQLTGMVLSSC